MQNEITLLKNKQTQFKINAALPLSSAVYLTELLYQNVENGKITLEINVKKGSLILNFFVTILEGVASAFIYDLIKIIYNHLKKERIEGKLTKPVYIFTLDEEYILTGDKDSKIPIDLQKELFK